MNRAVLISFQLWDSRRKAGFQHIASSLLHMGYEVLFITGCTSYLSYIKNDYRSPIIKSSQKNKIVDRGNALKTFIRFTNIHPVNLRNNFLNSISTGLFGKYSDSMKRFGDVNEFAGTAELFVFESFPGLLWFEYFKKLNTDAKFVYRVSDDIEFQNQHPLIIETEKKLGGRFDLISTPTEYIYKKFSGLSNVKLHHHGIDKVKFDSAVENPYSGGKNFVFTGNSYFDYNFLKTASENFLEINFHIIGPMDNVIKADNIIFHGELDFGKTVPLVKFADAGLHNLTYARGVESFSDSLKVIQYSYCNLPVISPEYIKSSRANFIYYKPGDKPSIIKAIETALNFDRSKIKTGDIYSWDVLTKKLIEE